MSVLPDAGTDGQSVNVPFTIIVNSRQDSWQAPRAPIERPSRASCPSSRNRPCRPAAAPSVTQPASAVAGAIQQAAQATGASFEYLLATAKVESNFNPNLTARTLVGDRAVPVHRADLARHDEDRPGRRSASATMPTRSRAMPPAAIRSTIRGCATRSCSCARIRPPTRRWRGAFTQQQRRRARASGSAASRPTASSTWRISSAPAAPRS